MTRLTPQAVEELFAACHHPYSAEGTTEVDTVAGKTWLRDAAVEPRKGDISALLAELPEQFMQTAGGGWSFVNACSDRHGELWTGMQLTMVKLLALGEAAGLVECLAPRDMWSSFPAGMPYYRVRDDLFVQPAGDFEEPF